MDFLFPWALAICLLVSLLEMRNACDMAHNTVLNRHSGERIVNGQTAPAKGYPFMAAIQSWSVLGWIQTCGGTILNEDTILTAAYCIFHMKPLWAQRVKVGTPDLKEDGQIFSVASATGHPSFNFEKGHYTKGFDVGIVKLSGRLSFTSALSVTRSCLSHNATKPDGERCLVLGWGETDTERYSDKLQMVSAPLQSRDDCLAFLPNDDLGADVTCVHNVEGISCTGDTGGPLICPVLGHDTTWLQFGIVSFGQRSCAGTSFISSVSYWIHWIREKATQV